MYMISQSISKVKLKINSFNNTLIVSSVCSSLVLCTSVDNFIVNPAVGSVRAGHHINM